MKQQNKQIGYLGESLAAEFLEQKGYIVLERNWGNKWGEIDLICEYHPRGVSHHSSGVIIFVEVKTKRGNGYGTPTEMVNYRKLLQIKRIAALYPAGINSQKRIDVVGVVLNFDLTIKEIKHYTGVY